MKYSNHFNRLIGGIIGANILIPSYHVVSLAEENKPKNIKVVKLKKKTFDKYEKDFSNMAIISGSSNRKLAEDIVSNLGTKLTEMDVFRFSDGEVNCNIKESVRGKDVFIIQTCAVPVNDNIMELLLSVTAARRAGANRVIAVVPYFGYKYHQRGIPLSTLYSSRFLWSASADLAKMLQTVGIDGVLSVDLQRPGQGHEACFFDSDIPVETVSATDLFVNYFKKTNLQEPIVIVSPNGENIKRARKFHKKLKIATKLDNIQYATSIHDNINLHNSEILGNITGADVIIVADVVDSAVGITGLSGKLSKNGARRIFLCAPHGLFTKNAMALIELSPITKVITTDSINLKTDYSKKIEQLSIAPLLSNIIETELKSLMFEREFDSNDNLKIVVKDKNPEEEINDADVEDELNEDDDVYEDD
jgi:ribose-phosphate pyrophosphokinase